MKYKMVICVTFASVLLGACTQSSVDLEAEQTALRAAADAYHEAAERGEDKAARGAGESGRENTGACEKKSKYATKKPENVRKKNRKYRCGRGNRKYAKKPRK